MCGVVISQIPTLLLQLCHLQLDPPSRVNAKFVEKALSPFQIKKFSWKDRQLEVAAGENQDLCGNIGDHAFCCSCPDIIPAGPLSCFSFLMPAPELNYYFFFCLTEMNDWTGLIFAKGEKSNTTDINMNLLQHLT